MGISLFDRIDVHIYKIGDFQPMLDFFRKYQRYFFLVITVVIIISFSFFGTYSTLGSNQWREQIAFKAVNGREVSRMDVDEMALFLATDVEDKVQYGGAWGPNFLNDGVIRKDFLETGLGEELALAYKDELASEMDKRLAKEKKYVLYAHPQAPFLSVSNAWNYFAPEMNANFDTLRAAQEGVDPHAFKSRIKLYLGEKKIPPSTLRYLLRYQEKQLDWLQPDEKLNHIDLSLFGYHTLDDWFGPHFNRLITQFIINAAILAENQGYDVSKAEVLSDLVRNTQVSYQQNLNNPNLGVTSPEEYLDEQLRRLNMDQARAIKVWRQVLLFRRYFHDAGATALIDGMANQKLHQFAHENVKVDLYQLPEALRLANYEDMQKFEVYLKAVAKGTQKDPLALPNQFLAVEEVEKANPQLVNKEYVLDVAEANQKNLQARIGLRELWNWEMEDAHWDLLVKQFPTLGAKNATTREQRFDALESLDPTTRTLVNAFSKQEMVKSHPEWIEQALSAAKSEKLTVGLRTEGGEMPFQGLDKKESREALIRLLDEAPLGVAPAATSPLYDFTADHQTFYRITVLERASKPEILTFAEARSDGTLDHMLKRQLEKSYASIREQNPTMYQNEKNEWRSFDSVKDLVANQYFEKILQAIEPLQKSLSSDPDKKSWSKDQAASLRFYAYLKQVKEGAEKGSPDVEQLLTVVDESTGDEAAKAKHPALADQWKVEKAPVTYNRQSGEKAVDGEAFALQDQAWSSLKTPPNGALSFYQVKSHGAASLEPQAYLEQAREAQFILGAEAQRHLMRQVLQELKSKNALSLAYLQTPYEEPEVQHQEIVDPGY